MTDCRERPTHVKADRRGSIRILDLMVVVAAMAAALPVFLFLIYLYGFVG
jgi:hypothetical protein